MDVRRTTLHRLVRHDLFTDVVWFCRGMQCMFQRRMLIPRCIEEYGWEMASIEECKTCFMVEIRDNVLYKLKWKIHKTYGTDDITHKLLAHLVPIGKMFILIIFNQSWHTGLVLSARKEAYIQPPLKPGTDKSSPLPTTTTKKQTHKISELCGEIAGKPCEQKTYMVSWSITLTKTNRIQATQKYRRPILTQDIENISKTKYFLAVCFLHPPCFWHCVERGSDDKDLTNSINQ